MGEFRGIGLPWEENVKLVEDLEDRVCVKGRRGTERIGVVVVTLKGRKLDLRTEG